jgi:hypothetical protein
MGQAGYEGVTFSYDTSMATRVRGQTVPSNVGQGDLISEVRPEHIAFSFDGYPSQGVWSPQIRVIPLAAYKAAHAQSAVTDELSALEGYIDSNMGSGTGGGSGSSSTGTPRTLPFLPPVNAQRIISEDVAPVVGAGVSGVRFIASYAQNPGPVGADNITYMFIGLTADGKYYVESTFPVALSTPLDPPPSPVTAENAQAYNQAVAVKLSNTDMMGFLPTLDKLDKMMSSVQVSGSVGPQIPGMPTTGSPAPEYGWQILPLLALGMVVLLAGVAISTRSWMWRRSS